MSRVVSTATAITALTTSVWQHSANTGPATFDVRLCDTLTVDKHDDNDDNDDTDNGATTRTTTNVDAVTATTVMESQSATTFGNCNDGDYDSDYDADDDG